jgi:putative aldouronate transport system substrate-binding protein
MRKWVQVSASALVILSLITGCAKTPGSTGTNAVAEKTKFSLVMQSKNISYVEKSPNINEDKWVKKLGELTHTELSITTMMTKDREQKMLQMFATNDLPDVVQTDGGVHGKEMAGSVAAGVFLPLDDLLNKYGQNLLKKIPKEAWERMKYNGNIYGIPEYLSNPSRRATVIRKDLLDKTGLPVPKTVDEYLKVMRAFKQLGVENPYMARENFKYADTFFGAYDVFPYSSMFEKQGDQIVPKFMNADNMQKALTLYKTMFDEGLINKEFATINPTSFRNTILSGKAGIWSMNANELLQWQAELLPSFPNSRLEIIPSPQGPDGKGGHYLYSDVVRVYLINKATKSPEKIIQFFDWMLSDEAEKFFTYGIEGENYTVQNGKIDYKIPTDPRKLDEEVYRQSFLWMVQDTTYNKNLLGLTEEGKKLISVFDNMLTKEGRDGIEFLPRLNALVKNPDIAPGSDTAPPVVLSHMVKMVYGKEPITDWPKVIEEWKSKGGNAVIQEATEKFNKPDQTPDTLLLKSRRN